MKSRFQSTDEDQPDDQMEKEPEEVFGFKNRERPKELTRKLNRRNGVPWIPQNYST